MEKDGYRWWMKRFQKMAEYFDAYRIDHILGFFRIWEIPMHAVHGLLGQFDPSLPMSQEEIERYGLTFRDEYLLPFIHDIPVVCGESPVLPVDREIIGRSTRLSVEIEVMGFCPGFHAVAADTNRNIPL